MYKLKTRVHIMHRERGEVLHSHLWTVVLWFDPSVPMEAAVEEMEKVRQLDQAVILQQNDPLVLMLVSLQAAGVVSLGGDGCDPAAIFSAVAGKSVARQYDVSEEGGVDYTWRVLHGEAPDRQKGPSVRVGEDEAGVEGAVEGSL